MTPEDPRWERFDPPEPPPEVVPIPIPPFSRYLIRLRFTRPARFRFFHGGALMGMLTAVLGRHLPRGVVPVVCERAQVRFEPGDPYHLGMTLEGEACGLIGALQEGLVRVGETAPGPGPLPTLGGNFEVEAVTELAPVDLEADVAALAAQKDLTLRFVSPFRQERPQPLKGPGRSFMGPGCWPLEHFLRRLYNRIFLLSWGRWPKGDERAAHPSLPSRSATDASRQLWLDVPVRGRPGADPNRPGGKTPGGWLGPVTVRGVPGEWLPLVAVGQHLHAGAATSYGLGRYLVDELTPAAADPFRPARSALARTCEPATLDEAADHVLANTVAAGVDGLMPEAFAVARGRILPELAAHLADGSHRPRPLLGIVGRDRPGKLRALAVPTLADRVAQKAACAVLGDAVEAILEDVSFAYRRGLSRSRAAVAIQRAYEDGYRWVLDADITSFFDSVPWPRVRAKLEALLPGEPLVELLMAWVESPVSFDGRMIERRGGLPQGAVISPLLANLYLDELDEQLLAQGFRLVRYADDFVVLCRDVDQARAAKAAAERALADLGLELNPAKTGVTSFDQGFTYLGYLFCRSLVLEGRRDDAEAEPPADPVVPAASWLAQAPMTRLRELARRGGDAAPRVEAVPLAPVGGDAAMPLYLVDPETTLHARGNSLVVEHPGAPSRALPLTELSHLVLVGRTRATVPLLRRLARGGVPTFLCRVTGELEATVSGGEQEWPLWLAQARLAEDSDARVNFARSIVAAKLHNAATLAMRFGFPDCRTVAGRLRDFERSCLDQQELDSLRGVEGSGARVFFGALARALPDGWGMDGRHRRPPPDPINAMLSFGYTLLYNHLATAVLAAGLNPRIGLFHAGRGRMQALACDLEEELRWLVDAFVWALVSRRRARPDEFRAAGPRRPCVMSQELCRRFLVGFEERLLTEFTPQGAGEPLTYRAFMTRQARQVSQLVLGRREAYEPLRIHA